MKKSGALDKQKGRKQGKPDSSPDKLRKAGRKEGAELTEDEMKKVSGGVAGGPSKGWIDIM